MPSALRLFGYGTVAQIAWGYIGKPLYDKYEMSKNKDNLLKTDDVLKSLQRLSVASPEELLLRVRSEAVWKKTPMINLHNMGCDSNAELAAKITNLRHGASIGIGVLTSATLAGYLFHSCLSKNTATLSTCSEAFSTSILDHRLGFALTMAGFAGFYVSKGVLAYYFNSLSSAMSALIRSGLIIADYTKLASVLTEVNGAAQSPQVVEEVRLLAKKLLAQAPDIAHALHRAASIDKAMASLAVMQLETACKKIVAAEKTTP